MAIGIKPLCKQILDETEYPLIYEDLEKIPSVIPKIESYKLHLSRILEYTTDVPDIVTLESAILRLENLYRCYDNYIKLGY